MFKLYIIQKVEKRMSKMYFITLLLILHYGIESTIRPLLRGFQKSDIFLY
jgi:hypothetical protein